MHEAEMTLLQKLTGEFGPLQSTNGVITRPDGSELPADAVAKAKAAVADEVVYLAVKDEASRRIFSVTKSITTQVNIAMFFAVADANDPLLPMAKKVIAWIDETRMTARKLKGNPKFHEDQFWPKSPDGVKEFIDRF